MSFVLICFAYHRLNSSEGYSRTIQLLFITGENILIQNLLKQFEEETGIKVIYETFDSNEAMMTKIQQGGTAYDIAVPSEYTIEKMKEENLLIPLDHSKFQI